MIQREDWAERPWASRSGWAGSEAEGVEAATNPARRATAMHAIGAPFVCVRMPEQRLRRAYEGTLLLIRPDLHVAWRGDALPPDADRLASLVTGHIVVPDMQGQFSRNTS